MFQTRATSQLIITTGSVLRSFRITRYSLVTQKSTFIDHPCVAFLFCEIQCQGTNNSSEKHVSEETSFSVSTLQLS